MTFAASVTNNQVALENNDVQRIVDTCCLGCVFAEGDFHHGGGQSLRFLQKPHGCCMDVLEKMHCQGQELQDSIDNDRNEFHVMRGRVCLYHRTPHWSGWAKQDLDLAKIQARQEVQLQPDVVIYFEEGMNPNSILETADALNQGKIRPKRLYLINNSDMLPSQMMKLMKNCPLPWRTETIAQGNITQSRALDLIVAKCTSIFVTFFAAGYQPPLNFFVPIDQALHDDLDRFVVLEPLPDSINCMTVLRNFYRQAGGMTLPDNRSESHIVDKAKRISEKQKCQYLVRPVTSVVRSLPQSQ
jgi:hypothetical protein